MECVFYYKSRQTIVVGGMPCVLVGHDWGGALTWRVIDQYPHLVESAVIMNCPHPAAMGKYMQRSWKQFLKSWYILQLLTYLRF